MSKNKNKTTILVKAEVRDVCRESLSKTVASALPDLEAQPDLLYMRSLLVSTGSNKNDDVFLPKEMWEARFSPALKFVNWEHNSGREATAEELSRDPRRVVVDNQIIGVMYNSFAVDENGVIINEEKAEASDFEIPETFHIVDEAVIYKAAFPKVAARVEKGAQEGTLFVSMETYFDGYDYLVGNKVVARNNETAFLESKLKANGGTGSFGANSVKRVLRGLVFGGKGIVERPANEPSIIQSVTHEPITASTATHKAIANNIIGNLDKSEELTNMSEDAKNLMPVSGPSFEEYKTLAQELAEVRLELKTKAKELETTKTELATVTEAQASLKTALAKGGEVLEKSVPGISEKLTASDTSKLFDVVAASFDVVKTEANEKTKAAEDALSTAVAELTELKNMARASERLSKVREELSLAAMEGDDDNTVASKLAQAIKIAEDTKELDDEAFASRVEDLKQLLAVAKKGFVPFGKKDDKKEDEKKGADEEKADKNKKAKTKADDSEEEILNSVKALAGLIPSNDDSGSNGAPDLNKAYAGLIGDLMSFGKQEEKN